MKHWIEASMHPVLVHFHYTLSSPIWIYHWEWELFVFYNPLYVTVMPKLFWPSDILRRDAVNLFPLPQNTHLHESINPQLYNLSCILSPPDIAIQVMKACLGILFLNFTILDHSTSILLFLILSYVSFILYSSLHTVVHAHESSPSPMVTRSMCSTISGNNTVTWSGMC